ncbi:ferredoxin [Actinoplanes sp. TBRC 11911]|uniref:ferredoxin n=1 Tax=Actinoplanes sp. TBRC 11911 TaxID=2729386 RepID=UPI00145E2AB7|nr:ferredoxin [Actinoplanes sp. TBRC 11911]NMO51911.1 ferredoxin [Actinoplanes sp. TBRC 11911]
MRGVVSWESITDWAAELQASPAHFAMGDDGRSHPRAAVTNPLEVLLDAAASCPMEAITVRNAETGEQLAPLTSKSYRGGRR